MSETSPQQKKRRNARSHKAILDATVKLLGSNGYIDFSIEKVAGEAYVGNPSSALVTATLFLRPLIARLSGFDMPDMWAGAVLTADLSANGDRENYLRGRYALRQGRVDVAISARQDSGLTGVFADANCLVKRVANAPAQKAGDKVTILPL
ncbi:MAG: hypothetical protein GWP34_07610 [Alphaproteobacteria bacterium]|nr:hypothetical protein [Alphaproteobacteria bacterium]